MRTALTMGVFAFAALIVWPVAGLPWGLGVVVCLATGALIGALIGLLVARLGIPSFVVTLAAFLGLQGVLLYIIGEGGTIPIRDNTLLAVMNKNMPVWLGWALYIVGIALYGLLSYRRMATRRSQGLHAETPVAASQQRRYYQVARGKGYTLACEARSDVFGLVLRWCDLIAGTLVIGEGVGG